MKTFSLFSILFFSIGFLFAQNIDFNKKNFKDRPEQLREAMEHIKDGNFYYNEQQYHLAMESYFGAYAVNPDNALLNFLIGECYLRTANKYESLRYFEKAHKLDPAVNIHLHYHLGEAYQLNYQWSKAINSYETYLTQQAKNLLIAEAKKKIEECKTGLKLTADSVRVFIDNLGPRINSTFADYGPLISSDESLLIFTSRRPNINSPVKNETGYDYYEDIFISKKERKQWMPAENIGQPVNSHNHDATVGLSADGQLLLIFKGDNGGDLFECRLEGEKWSVPERLSNTINTKYKESSASLSYDGRTLYFISDKPNGSLGGSDIYFSVRGYDGNWSQPENLGPTINTPFNEEAVFIHPDGKTLYFSSQGHNTMGGYDIFKTILVNGQWTKPENLGYPINTPDDDVFFVVSGSGRRAYYSSGRPGGLGDQDIYMITFLGPEKPVVFNTEDNLLAMLTQPVSETIIEAEVEIETNNIVLLTGLVLDSISGNPLEARIELIDNEKNELIGIFRSNSKTGKYLVSLPSGKNYGLNIKAEDYLFHSENFDIQEASNFAEVHKDVLLKTVQVGNKVVLNNIFFNVNEATLKQGSFAELDRLQKLLNELPKVRIELSGHTDNTGNEAYNIQLSEKRAKAVVDYLIGHGIEPSRLEFKGYGSARPVAENKTAEGRKLNRRTEFKVLSK
jgi:outer membrane protein OmpA-like peptidoglycan-associated protein/tetratricopeptide (TPR) repeat protein